MTEDAGLNSYRQTACNLQILLSILPAWLQWYYRKLKGFSTMDIGFGPKEVFIAFGGVVNFECFQGIERHSLNRLLQMMQQILDQSRELGNILLWKNFIISNSLSEVYIFISVIFLSIHLFCMTVFGWSGIESTYGHFWQVSISCDFWTEGTSAKGSSKSYPDMSSLPFLCLLSSLWPSVSNTV